MTARVSLAVLLERFFTQRLMHQRQASAHTIASYRDTFKMLLQFVQKRLHKAPSTLALEDIDAQLVAAFLDDLEATRGVTTRTRNLRLTAVHSFFRYASYEAPTHAAHDCTRAGHTGEEVQARLGALPQSSGGRCSSCGAGSAHVVRPPGPRADAAGGTDGAAAVGVDEPSQ